MNERVGKTGERASAITSAPPFRWSNVLNLPEMKSIEWLHVLAILFSYEEEIPFDICSDIWHFIGKEGGKSAMFV